MLWQAAHVTDWPAAFHSVNTSPWVVFHYPPLFHLASRALQFVTGNLLSAGRLVSVLSLLSICLLMTALSWKGLAPVASRSARALGALTSGLLIFTLPAWPWACLMRVDSLALLFVFSGLTLFVCGRRKPWMIYLCFLLFVAAIYTKQTMLAAPSACGLLLYLENRRLLLRAAGAALAAAVSVLVLLQTLTHGGFLQNIVGYNMNRFVPGQLLRLQVQHFEAAGPVLAAALLLPAMYLLGRNAGFSPERRLRLLLERNLFTRCSVVVATTLAFAWVISITVGKQGAAYNYFFEIDLLSSLGAGLFAGWVLQERAGNGRMEGYFAVFLTLCLAFQATRVETPLYEAIDAIRRPHSEQVSADLVQFLKSVPGRVYSEDMTVLPEAGKAMEAEPAIVTALALHGQWDETPFVRQIETGTFAVIVVNSSLENKERFTPRVARAVLNRYQPVRRIGKFVLYEPR